MGTISRKFCLRPTELQPFRLPARLKKSEIVRELGFCITVGNAVPGVPPLLAIAERHRGRSLQVL